MSENAKKIESIDVESLHKAFEDAEKAMDCVQKRMAKTFVTFFINDWKAALDRVISEEKLYSQDHDDTELGCFCFEELEEIESSWEESFVDVDERDDANSAVASINRQIRTYIFDLACECGYSGNYIENALASIAKKGEVSRISVFVDGLEMEKDE